MTAQNDYMINVHGQLLSLQKPVVMGILNCTPDSFFAGSRKQTEVEIAERTWQIINEGGSIIDVGAFSTRPGAQEVSEEEEMRRLRFALAIVRRESPSSIVSVDTYRPNVARMAVEEYGVDIINDVSEGGITGIVDTPLESSKEREYPEIFQMMGKLKVPYILMSVQGNLHDMIYRFSREIEQLHELQVKDIILDPGFGFGKTIETNYQILNEMDKLEIFGLPVLAGVSRKRMIHQLIQVPADEALNGTTVVDTMALMKGAKILRVHDVLEASQAVTIYNQLISSSQV
ncbi:dihydropteroate synthase [Segatella bryantii]|uniref:dihydropteroate synthase n=1 Tax=Segatella bryantii TaxID=77095 RepID=A0ABX4EIB4_SEGBR|nr:dihydropteroate synthase [Segatella bryantii]OYP55597.1 dihydropteroate synthase [Segatella bryantii]UKK76145.1 dihydropteroate synthase [Segatella bryantii]UKK80816.1 dihydropteroate synthase [Segatella bryantii]